MTGVAEQCKRVGHEAADEFQHHNAAGNTERDCKPLTVACAAMDMAMMRMSVMAVAMMMRMPMMSMGMGMFTVLSRLVAASRAVMMSVVMSRLNMCMIAAALMRMILAGMVMLSLFEFILRVLDRLKLIVAPMAGHLHLPPNLNI